MSRVCSSAGGQPNPARIILLGHFAFHYSLLSNANRRSYSTVFSNTETRKKGKARSDKNVELARLPRERLWPSSLPYHHSHVLHHHIQVDESCLLTPLSRNITRIQPLLIILINNAETKVVSAVYRPRCAYEG